MHTFYTVGTMISTRELVRISSLLLAFLVLSLSLRAQTPEGASAVAPLESRLNGDGSLKLGDGFSGALDPRGWQMTLAPDGSPRFLPASSTKKERSGLQSVSGNEGWDLRFGPAGVNGTVDAVAISGSDVYVGGHFSLAGDVVANNIARWDNDAKTWNALGGPSSNGVGGAAWAGRGAVLSILPLGDNVYVGGMFESAGDKFIDGIARWNKSGNEWFALGSGVSTHLEPSGTSRGGDVYAIIAHDNDIYIAGRFFKAGSEPAGNVARWDGTRWNIVGPNGDSTNGAVFAMAFYGNDLYIGGDFTTVGSMSASYLAKYTPSTGSWSALSATPDTTVYALLSTNNLLYAGGRFKKIGGVAFNSIASWDGANWRGLGTSSSPGPDGAVRSIVATNNGIVVGGEFQKVEGVIANGIARWSNASWTSLGTGVSGGNRSVYAIAAVGPQVFAGGSFTAAGSVAAQNVALWDSTEWKRLSSYNDPSLNRNGTNLGVYAVALHGADVYVGGNFTVAGGIPAKYVARWNSVTNAWSSLGTGIGGPAPFVRSLAFKGDTLFVGGIFTSAGGIDATGIAKWDGTSWAPVGGGVGGPNPFVFAMTTVGNDLYVAGAFSNAGSQAANRVAKWNGSTWEALGEGVGSDGYSYITAIAALGSDIYVGGDFTRAGSGSALRIAKWSGGSWSALGAGVNAPVSAIAVGTGGTVVGGDFTSAGGTASPYLALWNGGSWATVATVDGPVRSITIDASQQLLVGGEFRSINGTAANGLALRSGSTWKVFSDGGGVGVNGPVRALALNTQYIYTGGEFAVAGTTRANNIAQWDGLHFSSLGSDPATGISGPIYALAVKDTEVYVGGSFDVVGGLRANGVARWNGYFWSRVGGGFDGNVRALAVAPNGDLYAGGEFTMAEFQTVHGVAVWNGSSWGALAGGVGGSFPQVYALAIGGDYLYLGGRFSTAGGLPAHRIARWSMSGRAWSSVGDGIGGASDFTYVNALVSRHDTLFAGGVFASAGGVPARNLARWDGTRWYDVGGGVDDIVYALAIGLGGELYVGGDFNTAGTLESRNIALWDGSTWANLGEGMQGRVYSIVPGTDGMIYVGGTFNGAGTVESGGIVRWDGHTWQGLGSGVSKDTSDGLVSAIAISGDNVFVGGDFTVAGGRSSLYFGRWNRTLVAVPNTPSSLTVSGLAVENVPNPFRGSTFFTFTLPGSGFTTLDVFDARGIEVAHVTSEMMAPGDHTVAWNAGDLPSGVYYYRLRQGSGVTTRSLVICR